MQKGYSFSNTEQLLFAQRLRMLLVAGVPLISIVRLLQVHTHASAGFRKVLAQVESSVFAGHSLAAALKGAGSAIDGWGLAIIEAGESSGSLAEHVGYWQQQLQARVALVRQLRTALVYPLVVLCLLVVQVGVLYWFILPRLLPLFSSLHYELPLATRLLLVGYSGIAQYWLWGLVLCAPLVLLVRYLQVRGVTARLFDFCALRMPIVRGIYCSYQTWALSQSMGVLLQTGMPLMKALQLTQRVVQSNTFRLQLARVTAEVSAGASVSKRFKQQLQYAPLEFLELVAAGEHSGQLAASCMQSAAYLFETIQYRLVQLSALFEPALLLFVACCVGFVAFAIISPLYGITQSIHY